MNVKNSCLNFIIIFTVLVFSACSLSTLSFSLISTESFESGANSSIINLQVAVTSSFSNTTISWESFKINSDDNTDYYQDEYTILRSDKNPWDGFKPIGTIHLSALERERARISFKDTDKKTGGGTVWYRIYFSYLDKVGDTRVTKTVLSESVETDFYDDRSCF